MPFQLTFLDQPGYLHAIVTGENSADAVKGYLEAIHRECNGRNCFRVLIEERLTGPRLSGLDVFRIAEQGSRRAAGVIDAIAYVDMHAEGNLMALAEDVAVNRGLSVAVFKTVPEAEAWLRARGS